MTRALLLLLTLSFAALATPSPTLTFDSAALGTTVKVVERPEVKDDWTGSVLPAHTALLLGSSGARSGDLDVFDVDELLNANGANDGRLHWLDIPWNVRQLRAVLERRAATSTTPGPLPFVPLEFGDQVLHAAVKYLDFGGVKGVRYVTAFTTRFDRPLDRREVRYTFQGFTNDGKFLVTWRQTVEWPDVLPNGPVTNWEAYRARLTEVLDGFTNDSRLTTLDHFLSTLRVH